MKNDAVFGVSIELALRSAFADRRESDHNDNFYKLLSHFDEMRIRIVTKPKEFIENGNEEPEKVDLLNTHGENRKLFFYCIGSEAHTADDQIAFLDPRGEEQRKILYQKPFMALIGIKLSRTFFKEQQKARKKNVDACDQFDCVENILKHFCKLEDYCMLRCLGAEDIYLFCRAKSIDSLLSAIHHLRAFRCANTVENNGLDCDRHNSGMPVVLETHTHFGFWAELKHKEIEKKHGSDQSYDHFFSDFEFEIQIRQYAGVNTNNTVSRLKDAGLSTFVKTAGQYGLVARGKINLCNLIKLYEDRAFDWRHEGHHLDQVNYTTGRFFISQQVGQTPVNRKDESEVEGIGAIEAINKLFKMLMQAISKSVSLNVYLKSATIKELTSLCIMSCQRLYKTYYWGEFRDILHFFRHYLEHLQVELKQIEYLMIRDSNSNNNYGELYRKHVFQSIDKFNHDMSAVLSDRLMLGRPMQENVRQSVYTTGAYEDLIQFYRVFIRQLRQLYGKVCLSSSGDFVPLYFHFLFVPLNKGLVRSDDLFPNNNVPLRELQNDGTEGPEMLQIVSFIHMGAGDLWNFQKSMVLLSHEVGHYLFIYNTTNMQTTFINSAVKFFIFELVQKLRCMYYPSAPEGMVREKADALYTTMTKYLLKKLSASNALEGAEPESVFVKNLDQSAKTIISLIRTAIENQFESKTSEHENYMVRKINDKEEGFEIVQAILAVYDAFDLLPMMSMSSYGFYSMIDTLICDACSFANRLMAECRADLFAISLLDLKFEYYVKCLIYVQAGNDNEISDEDEARENEPLGALRLLSAAYYDYLRTRKKSTPPTSSDIEGDFSEHFFDLINSINRSRIYDNKSYEAEVFRHLSSIAIKMLLNRDEAYIPLSQLWYHAKGGPTPLEDLVDAYGKLHAIFDGETSEFAVCRMMVKELRDVFENGGSDGMDGGLEPLVPLMRYMQDHLPLNNYLPSNS